MSTTSGDARSHVPVLLAPVISGLNMRPAGCYIDGTFGRGGHSAEIWKRLGPGGRLLAIDRDPQAIVAAESFLREPTRFEIVKGEIADIRKITAERNLLGKVDGLLFDLGVSSPQLDDPRRGFSFRSDGPLDMRMDPTTGISAADWLATVDEKRLKKVLFQFGEERFAGRIAKAVARARERNPIRRTVELAEIVADAVPSAARRKGEQRKHPATKTFQAIRIQVNDELQQLQNALDGCAEVLSPGGRLCVISFHSLEDRLVKRFIRNASREPEAWRGMPSIPDAARPPFRTIGRAVMATEQEIAANPRARSARLRIAERA